MRRVVVPLDAEMTSMRSRRALPKIIPVPGSASTFELRIRLIVSGNGPKCGRRQSTRNPRLRGLRVYPIRGFRNYLMFHLPLEDGVEIVRVIHGARDIAKALRLA